MVELLISILVAVVIVGLILWALPQMGIPEPLNRIIKVVVILVVVIWLIYLLLGLSGGSPRFINR